MKQLISIIPQKVRNERILRIRTKKPPDNEIVTSGFISFVKDDYNNDSTRNDMVQQNRKLKRFSIVPLNGGTNRLLNWYDIFECIYDCQKNTVTSKLRIWSSEPILSSYSVPQGIYTIKSMYNITLYDGKSERNHTATKYLINKYIIKGNKYICIK